VAGKYNTHGDSTAHCTSLHLCGRIHSSLGWVCVGWEKETVGFKGVVEGRARVELGLLDNPLLGETSALVSGNGGEINRSRGSELLGREGSFRAAN
jgi:hypothetical protein